MNWQERINRARETGEFTEEEVDELANVYDKCAVAEFNGSVGSHAKTATLSDLGMEFWRALSSNDFDEAQDWHDAIKRECIKEGFI